MFTRFTSAAAVALAAASLVSAQTFTACDPTKKDCPADPALGGSVSVDFTKGAADDIFTSLAGTTINYDGSNGAVFAINKETDAPTMASHKYIFFGKIDVVLRAAPGAGIVTSMVLQSDDLDEIDWEWVGGDNAQVQTNYFSKGDTSTYDRGAYHPVTNPTGEFHTYTIDWTKDYVKWIINGQVVRTLNYADAKGGSAFPQTPMQIKLGTWVAGRKDAPKGTVDWAGGYTNFADAPFIGYYKSIAITDYAGGVSGAKEYVYGDRSGTYQSIIVKTEGGSSSPSGGSSSASAAPSKSSTVVSSAAPSTQTTLTTVTTSASTVSPSASAQQNSTTAAPSGTGSGSGSSSTTRTGASTTPTTSSVTQPGAGMMNRANLALGAAGLFFAFLL